VNLASSDLFDGIPIRCAQRAHCGLHSRARTSHHGSDGRVEDSGPRRCGGTKRRGGARQGLWPSRCRSRLEGDNRHTVPDRLGHEVVHVHGLALLVDERRLDWKKPVRDYIPEFRLHDAVATDRITVRDFLCHHSGLPRHDWIWIPGDLSPAQMLAAMRYLEPSDDIRSTFQYLNLGYLVASMVTERVSGQSWPEFTRARLTDKLRMNVTFTVEDLAAAANCRRALHDGREHPPALETLADPRAGRGRHQHLNCELRELASPSSRQRRV